MELILVTHSTEYTWQHFIYLMISDSSIMTTVSKFNDWIKGYGLEAIKYQCIFIIGCKVVLETKEFCDPGIYV